MQCPSLLAFRKRLSKRGYTNIHICQAVDSSGKRKTDFYVVSAVEPLSKTVVSAEYHVISFSFLMR